ncbi:glutathione S-transferase family protein [Micavibrio aeruginosavorus]|uniref:Glutathione S-transferase n=1 Tax=Micavibrio aeruginosavorus EPB TaxID=349215 RepID=M4VKG9_9BACT|nr:glutathione S-transferase family protein [Micavibrio aeruginosavorus]AGH98975.1 Glutathione S-transferase [Micavibrio aeruginosavorus EPB]
MSYTLYYKPGACSMAMHVILNELNVPFDAVKQDDLKAPDFLKLNPRGQVPLLVVDGEPVKEGAAIILYLLDTHANTLMPASGIERAKALEWLMWCNASLHPACSRMFWLNKQTLDDATKAQLAPLFLNGIQALWDEAEARLATTKYLAGDTITAADILLSVIANWGLPVTLGANVKRVLKDVTARPAYQKTLAAEQIEYKAAA